MLSDGNESGHLRIKGCTKTIWDCSPTNVENATGHLRPMFSSGLSVEQTEVSCCDFTPRNELFGGLSIDTTDWCKPSCYACDCVNQSQKAKTTGATAANAPAKEVLAILFCFCFFCTKPSKVRNSEATHKGNVHKSQSTH